MTAVPPSLSPDLLDAAVELMGRSGREGLIRVRGTSMVPTILPGQTLAVEFSPARLLRGDVMLFRLDDMLVVHRLLGPGRRRGRRYLRARGDGRIRLDPPVFRDSVVGRVVAVRDGEVWRSMRGRAARGYAWSLAWHDYAWAAAAVVARVVERGLRRAGLPIHLEARVRDVDRWVLRRAHRLLFARVHPVVEPPNAADD